MLRVALRATNSRPRRLFRARDAAARAPKTRHVPCFSSARGICGSRSRCASSIPRAGTARAAPHERGGAAKEGKGGPFPPLAARLRRAAAGRAVLRCSRPGATRAREDGRRTRTHVLAGDRLHVGVTGLQAVRATRAHRTPPARRPSEARPEAHSASRYVGVASATRRPGGDHLGAKRRGK